MKPSLFQPSENENDEIKAFNDAFDYFFHTNCNDNSNANASRAIANKFREDSSLVRRKTKTVNKKLNINTFLSTLNVCSEFSESLGIEASYAAIHLNMLFELPTVKTLFAIYDSIVKFKADYEFPKALTNEADCACYLKGTRLINIVISENQKLGLRLDIDERSGLAFVSEVVENSAAQKSGCIKKGDFILEINESETKYKSVDELDELLAVDSDSAISLLLESNIKNLKQEIEFPYFYRALVDFTPSSSIVNDENLLINENLLHFSKGDVFEVFGSLGKSWLKARLVQKNLFAASEFVQDSDDLKCQTMKSGLISQNSHPEDFENLVCVQYMQNFEKVVLLNPCSGIMRCILLVGPNNIGRSELKKKLISTFPDKYANVVPHTTRKPRNYEVDGVDYNFVGRIDMEQLIYSGNCLEHGEYNNNLYGTTYASILELMEQGKVPVLCVNPKTIFKLRNVTFKPLIIFVKPPDIMKLKETRTKLLSNGYNVCHFSDMDFKDMIAGASLLQRNFGAIFDDCLINGDFNETFANLCKLLKHYETFPHFLPEEWVDWI